MIALTGIRPGHTAWDTLLAGRTHKPPVLGPSRPTPSDFSVPGSIRPVSPRRTDRRGASTWGSRDSVNLACYARLQCNDRTTDE
jgi:hypothetical protein